MRCHKVVRLTKQELDCIAIENSHRESMYTPSFFLLLVITAWGSTEGVSRPFPFGPRRRILPGQRASGCVDCATDLKQCVQKCLQQHDCSEMDVKEGFCPVGASRPEKCAVSAVLSVCENDTDCPGTKKCCENGCSKVCANALPVPSAPARQSKRNSKLG